MNRKIIVVASLFLVSFSGINCTRSSEEYVDQYNKKWIVEKSGVSTTVYLLDEGDIKIRNYVANWPPHKGGDDALFYKDKIICSSIESISPNFYLLSPELKLILYINKENFKKDLTSQYAIYDTGKDVKILFNNMENKMLVGLNDKAEWLDDKVILSNNEQRDILNLKDGTMKIEKIESK